MSLARHRVCFFTNLPRGGWVVCATTGSMHADRVKTLLLFGVSHAQRAPDGTAPSGKFTAP